MHKALAVLILFLGGCDLYFGGDDDDVCNEDVGYGGDAQQFRDPSSGQCSYQGGGGGWCNNTCEPCPAYDTKLLAQPDWAVCYGSCENLTEDACVEQAGCRAAYLDDPTKDGYRVFWGCWETAPSGPIHGICTGLDAQQCSRHDDCSAMYSGTLATTSGASFESCLPETHHNNSCAATVCGPGYTCVEVCSGDDASTCQASCIPDHSPGECYAFVACDALPPTCPTGTTPGVLNGCWSGYCIPVADCTMDCTAITSESTCVSRADCVAVYDGSDCTCYGNSCTCQTLDFNRCEMH